MSVILVYSDVANDVAIAERRLQESKLDITVDKCLIVEGASIEAIKMVLGPQPVMTVMDPREFD